MFRLSLPLRARAPQSWLRFAGCVASMLLLGPQAAAPAQQRQVTGADDGDEVVRVTTDLVVLNATVTGRRGEFVHGLRAADFKVFEDGREQKVSNFDIEATPFAVALLLDISGSMEGRLSLARAAAIRFLDGLRADDTAAVYSFESKVTQVQEFSPSRDLAPNAFGLSARGTTVLYDAIVQAAKDLEARPEKRRAIVVLSDGADTRSAASFDRALAAALTANATIYTVNLADREHTTDGVFGANALAAFADKSGGRFINTPGGQALREAFIGIVDELSNQYTISYRPDNRIPDGRWRTIELRVVRPETKARTRRGYRLAKNK